VRISDKKGFIKKAKNLFICGTGAIMTELTLPIAFTEIETPKHWLTKSAF